MRIAMVVTAALMVVSATAHADDDAKKRSAQIKALVQKQVDEWGKSESPEHEKALSATLTADALVSGWASETPKKGRTIRAPENTAHVKVVATQVGWAGTWGWAALEVHSTWRIHAEPSSAGNPNPKDEAVIDHWLELFVVDGNDVKGKVLSIARAKPDKALIPYNYVEEMNPAKSPPQLLAWAADVSTLASHLSSDASTCVLGSSDTEVATTAADAKKLVGSWKGVTLQPATYEAMYQNLKMFPLEVTIGDVTVVWGLMIMQLPNKTDRYPVTALVFGRKTSSGQEIVAISYMAD